MPPQTMDSTRDARALRWRTAPFARRFALPPGPSLTVQVNVLLGVVAVALCLPLLRRLVAHERAVTAA